MGMLNAKRPASSTGITAAALSAELFIGPLLIMIGLFG